MTDEEEAHFAAMRAALNDILSVAGDMMPAFDTTSHHEALRPDAGKLFLQKARRTATQEMRLREALSTTWSALLAGEPLTPELAGHVEAALRHGTESPATPTS